MKNNERQSDQFTNWSADKYEDIDGSTLQATAKPYHAAGLSRLTRAARIAHRAVQAMWQARLQVYPGARAWPQVLSVGEYPWEATGDGVCAPGRSRAGQAAAGESAGVSSGPGGALRHKPRTPDAAGRTVGRKDDSPRQRGQSGPYRCWRGEYPRGQHAGAGGERWPLTRNATGGGKRCKRR